MNNTTAETRRESNEKLDKKSKRKSSFRYIKWWKRKNSKTSSIWNAAKRFYEYSRKK